MRKKAAVILGAIIILIGLGDAITAGAIFRRMLGGVTIILGILIFILAELFEISDALKQRSLNERSN